MYGRDILSLSLPQFRGFLTKAHRPRNPMESATLIALCRHTVQNSRSICRASHGAVDSARLTVERAKDVFRRTATVLGSDTAQVTRHSAGRPGAPPGAVMLTEYF